MSLVHHLNPHTTVHSPYLFNVEVKVNIPRPNSLFTHIEKVELNSICFFAPKLSNLLFYFLTSSFLLCSMPVDPNRHWDVRF